MIARLAGCLLLGTLTVPANALVHTDPFGNFATLTSTLANAPPFFCEDCRDLAEFPEDARNFAYNQVRGPDSWMTFEQADRFRVADAFGNVVGIDVNLKYEVFEIAFRSLEIDYANKLIMQIRVIYRNGDIVTYTFDTEDIGPNDRLPVGVTNTRDCVCVYEPGTGGGPGDGGSEDDPPDHGDYEDEPPEVPGGPGGIVTIEDPPYEDPFEDEYCEEC